MTEYDFVPVTFLLPKEADALKSWHAALPKAKQVGAKCASDPMPWRGVCLRSLSRWHCARLARRGRVSRVVARSAAHVRGFAAIAIGRDLSAAGESLCFAEESDVHREARQRSPRQEPLAAVLLRACANIHADRDLVGNFQLSVIPDGRWCGTWQERGSSSRRTLIGSSPPRPLSHKSTTPPPPVLAPCMCAHRGAGVCTRANSQIRAPRSCAANFCVQRLGFRGNAGSSAGCRGGLAPNAYRCTQPPTDLHATYDGTLQRTGQGASMVGRITRWR